VLVGLVDVKGQFLVAVGVGGPEVFDVWNLEGERVVRSDREGEREGGDG
jgi:hypothetical protein